MRNFLEQTILSNQTAKLTSSFKLIAQFRLDDDFSSLSRRTWCFCDLQATSQDTASKTWHFRLIINVINGGLCLIVSNASHSLVVFESNFDVIRSISKSSQDFNGCFIASNFLKFTRNVSNSYLQLLKTTWGTLRKRYQKGSLQSGNCAKRPKGCKLK